MAKNYKIVFDRDNCIGAGPCAAFCPENWHIGNDAKAIVKKTDINEQEFKNNLKAAESCPVNVIHIFEYDEQKKAKGKKLI